MAGKQDVVRLYRMQPRGGAVTVPVADWISGSDAYRNMMAAAGRWFAATADDAAWYAREHPDGEIVFVDLPRDVAESFRVSAIAAREGPRMRDMPDSPAAWSARPEEEFFVSREAAAAARPLASAMHEAEQEPEGAAPPMSWRSG